MSKQVNLLEGSILGKLSVLALPIMMTAFVQMAYNLVDMVWIGQLGSNAVAAVGAAGTYLWIADSCTSVAKTGGQIKVAHSIGEGNPETLEERLSTEPFFSIIVDRTQSTLGKQRFSQKRACLLIYINLNK